MSATMLLAFRVLATETNVVRRGSDQTADHREVAERLQRSFPQPHHQRDDRIARQSVQLGSIAKGEYGHDARAADSGGS